MTSKNAYVQVKANHQNKKLQTVLPQACEIEKIINT